MIKMADGSSKAVEDVQKGDMLMTQNGPEAVEVRAAVEVLASQLLRAHVARRPEGLTLSNCGPESRPQQNLWLKPATCCCNWGTASGLASLPPSGSLPLLLHRRAAPPNQPTQPLMIKAE